MDIRGLEAYLALAEHLNFTRSAEQFNISQSAFSRQITKLEAAFGCELFTRNKRTVALSPYGAEFLPYAQNIYAGHQKWLEALRRMKAQKTGRLRTAFLQDLPHMVFPAAVRRFEENHPEIELTLQGSAMSDIPSGLLEDTLDVGFTLSDGTAAHSGIACLELATTTLCAALPDAHPLAGRHSVHMGELQNETFVMVAVDGYSSVSQHIARLCRKAGFEPKVAAYTAAVPSLLMMVSYGAGISIVAQTAQALCPAGVRLVPLAGVPKVKLLLLWKAATENPAVAAFVESTQALL